MIRRDLVVPSPILAAILATVLVCPLLGAEARDRKPFAGSSGRDERHSLLDEWKEKRDPGTFSRLIALPPAALGTGGSPIVGRASMVINPANSIVYTKNFIGYTNNCDVDANSFASWKPSTPYLAGDHVRNGQDFMATTSGTSGTTGPSCASGIGSTVVDGTVTWVCEGLRWTANQAYSAGMVVGANSGVGFQYQAQNSGTSGATEPLFPTVSGQTVNDNGIVWKAIGNPPGSYRDCNPMQFALRNSAGGETMIAAEGDLIGASNLSGWGEFIAMNSSGRVAFKAAIGGMIATDDEGTAVLLAGPAAGTISTVAASGTIVAGRFDCGFAPTVGINDNGQVVYDAYTYTPGGGWTPATTYAANQTIVPATPNGFRYIAAVGGTSGGTEPAWPTRLNSTVVDGSVTWKLQTVYSNCDEEQHGLTRFTPGTGNELLVAVGSSFAGSTVKGFGDFGVTGCTQCSYDNIEGLINAAGHVPVVLSFTDGTQGVYDFTAPGVATEVARTGGANPYTLFMPHAWLNDVDQVVFRGVSAGVNQIFRFTPPSTTVTVASVGDDIGTRTGGSPNGRTITDLGNYFDINNSGNIVFQARLSSAEEGFYFWDGATGTIKEIIRQTDTSAFTRSQRTLLAPEMITVNDANNVGFVTGSQGFEYDASEGGENGGAFIWKAGGTQKAIAVGDVVGGDTVTGLYAQHLSFARRQFNATSCLATAYTVAGDDNEMDCSEGENTPGCFTKSPLLFVGCAATAPCPTILVSPPTLPGGAVGSPYSQTLTASGGVGPYNYALSAGILPPGLTLSTAGLISGTPNTPGSRGFTVMASDANNCVAFQPYTIVIGNPGQVSITIAPTALTTIPAGTTQAYTVTISAAQTTDTIVTLSSSDPTVASVPGTVTILANQTTATFNATGLRVGGPVVISASLPSGFGAPPATAHLAVGKANTTTTTVASGSVVVGNAINDTATLTGGAAPTGSMTFTAFGPNNGTCSGTPAFTATQAVSGNGNYSSGSFTPAAVGTWQFVAAYSGDVNNNPSGSPCGAANESVVVTKASPGLVTTASQSVALGGTISDSATLSSGFNPKGSITFALFPPNDTSCSATPIFTSTVPVNGNGVYTSNTFTPPAAGTYRWKATYSGDTNNNVASSACNAPNESVVVTKGTPGLATTASPGVTLGGTVHDTATLASGFNPTGTITFNLFGPNNTTCAGTPVFTNTVTVAGNGSYQSANFTPTAVGTYRWIASYSGDANNNGASNACNDPNESVIVSAVPLANPTIVTTASGAVTVGGTISDSATLSGGNAPTGTITFSAFGPNNASCTGTPVFTRNVTVNGNGTYASGPFVPTVPGTYQWTARYNGDTRNNTAVSPCGAPNESVIVSQAGPALTTTASPGVTIGSAVSDTATLSGGVNPTGTITFRLFGPNDGSCAGTPVFSATVNVNGNGSYSSGSFTPTTPGTYQYVVSYSGDANNAAATSPCGAPNETVVVSPNVSSTTLSTVASPSTVIGGVISDTATLSGGNAPTGSITFSAFGPNTNCGRAAIFSSTVAVNGNGTYSSGNFTPPAAGIYQWVASYSGDSRNTAVSGACGDPNEAVFVAKASPTVANIASPTVGLGGNISDTATLSGGVAPGGTLTFNVFGPDNAFCSGTPLFSAAVPVTGNGSYTSPTFSPTAVGTYRFVVVYSGDGNNNGFTTVCGAPNTTVVVGCGVPAAPVISVIGEATSGRVYNVQWTGVLGASAFQLEEASTPAFTDASIHIVNGTSFTFSHTTDRPVGFFYRVRAIASCNQQPGPYSDFIRIVIVPLPPPDRPSSNVNIPAGSKTVVIQQVFIPGVPGQSFLFTAAIDKPWMTISPRFGTMTPEGVLFDVGADPSNLPNGTFTGTVIVTLTPIFTGPTRANAIVSHDTTVVQKPISVNLVTPVTNGPATAPQTSSIIIPSVGHLDGISSHWQSDVRVNNPTASRQSYQLIYAPGTAPTADLPTPNVKTTTINVDAGDTIALDDIVRNWYGIGSLGDSANGYLEIRPVTQGSVSLARPVIATSRTYNVSNAVTGGTLGQFIPAVPFSDFIARSLSQSAPSTILSLQQIAQTAAFRTNVGIVEGSGKPATVLLSVFDAAGGKLKDLTVNLLGGEQKQLNGILEQNKIVLPDGRIQVQVTGGDGKVTAYASVIDNRSGVPLLVSGVPLGALATNRFVLPGVADLNTGIASWRTDMRIFNGESTSRTASLTFYPENNSGAPTTIKVTVNPNEVKTLDNVLQSLFGQRDIGGAVHVVTPTNSSLIVSGRTYNVTPSGTLGQFIPAVTAQDAVGKGERALNILQVEDSVRYRTNLGLAEVSGQPVVLEVTVALPDSKVTPKLQVQLRPNEFRQFRIINSLGLGNIYNARISVRVVDGTGRVAAYGSVIDEVTQAPTYVPAQ